VREITGSLFCQETKSDRCGGLVLKRLFWELRTNAGNPCFFKYLKSSKTLLMALEKKLCYVSRNTFRRCENCRKAGGQLIWSFAS
jgi:hypothetical protein